MKPGNMTIGEFDAYVESVPNGSDLELIGGTPVPKGNPTDVHELIGKNIAGALKPCMDARGCRVDAGNIRVQASSGATGKNKFMPDVVVCSGPVTTNKYVLHPIGIVEILSPSTMDRDRGVKLAFYKKLPAAQHIVLAYSDQMRVEHYMRTESGWECEVLSNPESILELEAVDFRTDLDGVYLGVPTEKAPRPRLRPALRVQ